jgi:hypothetical protein
MNKILYGMNSPQLFKTFFATRDVSYRATPYRKPARMLFVNAIRCNAAQQQEGTYRRSGKTGGGEISMAEFFLLNFFAREFST